MSAPSPHDTDGSSSQTHNGGPAPGPAPERLGQYLLLEKLGQGGMGVVYKALHTHLKKVVAIKVLTPDRALDGHLLARFHREMEAVGKLDSAHIVRATDAAEEKGRHYLVMEFVDGVNLAELARRAGPLGVADACELVRQAAAGLQHAFEHGLVHRDVKPSNLMLSAGGQVKVLDLGLARLQGVNVPGEELTASGQVMGTADYMAPEQGSGHGLVDTRADVYGLGCTLYRLLAGQPPFPGPRYDTVHRKLWAHAYEPVPPLRGLREDVPAALAAALDRMLAKAPANRYASPGEVAAALQPFVAGCDLAALVTVMAGPGRGPESVDTRRPAGERGAGDTKSFAGRPAGGPPDGGARRRAWLAVACLAAAALLAAVSAALFLLPRGGTPETAPPRPPNAGGPKPGEWRDLLDRAPVALQWPRASVTSHWDFKERDKGLWVNVDDEGLLRLGEAPEPPFEIEVGFEQIHWGEAGLFFGHQDGERDGHPCKLYQLIKLTHRRELGGAEHFDFDRTLACRFTAAAAVNRLLASATVPLPASQVHRLRIVVGKEGLEAVYWDDGLLPALTAPAANAPFKPADYRGAYGTYNVRSSAVFRGARWRLLPEVGR
ncbi:MAG TPA: serine/threonine-protein kinase [Gemmataceae bacterium]|nr:serine/threonine-protein kinase [Gemmataceae bacterium]